MSQLKRLQRWLHEVLSAPRMDSRCPECGVQIGTRHMKWCLLCEPVTDLHLIEFQVDGRYVCVAVNWEKQTWTYSWDERSEADARRFAVMPHPDPPRDIVGTKIV